MSTHTDYTDIMVCVDCALTANGYESTPEDGQPEPWALYPDAGIGDLTDNHDSETLDGYDPFSWSRCEGCGCGLGGERFRVADWASAYARLVHTSRRCGQ